MLEIMLTPYAVPQPEFEFTKAFRINMKTGSDKTFSFNRRYAQLKIEISNGTKMDIGADYPTRITHTDVTVPGTASWIDVYARPTNKWLPYGLYSRAGFREVGSPWRVTSITQWDQCNVDSVSFNAYELLSLPSVLPAKLRSLEDIVSSRLFNQDISTWDVSNITALTNAFQNCSSLNQNLNNWDVSNVDIFRQVFAGCDKFNKPLDAWVMSKATDISGMFRNCRAFNQNLSNWDTSNVVNMGQTFVNCNVYNQPMSTWKTGKVKDMTQFMANSPIFNQDLSGWDVSNVTRRDMFDSGATAWLNSNKPKFV